MPYPYVKFEKKHDKVVTELVPPNVLELRPNRAEIWPRARKKCAPEVAEQIALNIMRAFCLIVYNLKIFAKVFFPK